MLRIAARPIATATPHPVVSHLLVVTPIRTHVLASVPAARGTRRTRTAPGAAAPKPPAFSNSKPIWDVAAAGSGAGAGVSQSGNAGGTSGESTSGDGSAAGNEPCGYVEFSDPHGSHFDPQTHGFWVDIRMTVHFADGSSQATMLDYPWYYPSEAANPWSQANLRDPNFLPRFQPPPVAKVAGEPPLVQYVIAHSTPDGLTLLKECPAATPAS
jgi:hypothetical protein